MATLYGLRTQAMDLIETLRDLEEMGEDDDMALLQKQLELQEEIETKAVRIMMVVEDLNHQAEAHKQDAQNCLVAAKQLERKIQYLKTALSELMTAAGHTTIRSSYGTIKTSNRTEWHITASVPVYRIPSTFLTSSINKSNVKTAIKNGEDVSQFFAVEVEEIPTLRVWRKRAEDESETNPF